jgi:hypothetical protein
LCFSPQRLPSGDVRKTLQKKRGKDYRDNQKNKYPLLNPLLLGLDQYLTSARSVPKENSRKVYIYKRLSIRYEDGCRNFLTLIWAFPHNG